MKPEDQIKAIAELDGYRLNSNDTSPSWSKCYIHPTTHHLIGIDKLPDYLNSRDAIIPVIEKQRTNMRLEVGIQLAIMRRQLHGYPTQDNVEGWIIVALTATPSQLCEALLRATGKWSE